MRNTPKIQKNINNNYNEINLKNINSSSPENNYLKNPNSPYNNEFSFSNTKNFKYGENFNNINSNLTNKNEFFKQISKNKVKNIANNHHYLTFSDQGPDSDQEKDIYDRNKNIKG